MIRILCLSLMLSFAGHGIAQAPPAVPAQHSSHAPSQAAPSAAEVWDSLMAGNRRFVAGKPQTRAVQRWSARPRKLKRREFKSLSPRHHSCPALSDRINRLGTCERACL